MKKSLLEVKNLSVETNKRKILKGVDFEIESGEVQALLGPNASGKSTLAQIISGNPKFKVVEGRILFRDEDITSILPEERVKRGVVLSWQAPPSVKGVKFSEFLNRISKKKISDEILDIGRSLLGREVNVDFSGGERKLSELLQILSLDPKLVIFDEIDSGLDLNKMEKVAKIIKKKLIDKGVAVLLITHSGDILHFLKPKIVNVMVKGKIICRSKDYKKVLEVIKKYSYEKCKKCKLLAD